MTYHMNLQREIPSVYLAIGKNAETHGTMSFPQPHVRLNSGSKLYWLACDKPVGPCENKTRNEKKRK